MTLVAGNYIPTFYPDQLMSADRGVDFCIHGEGEFSFLNLVDHVFKNNTSLQEISGLSYRENGIIKSNPIQGHIKALDEIPIPDRKLVNFNYRLQQKSTSMITSRGCPFKCTFCYFEGIMGHVWRPRSVKNIMEEILMLDEQGSITVQKNRVKCGQRSLALSVVPGVDVAGSFYFFRNSARSSPR
jgi:anaerobic magnesium-protoporphyrin IX monomethyl ester cyclase